ncbi:MAG: methylenetetrahydrofolate reductase [Deltaproteobacteria bacterium]|nr:methylenetetrahydrofolate reductase [Deltaproteobacteria bacterium]MBF0523702.1 methylenetetrahydrofolate reductase [Deltaproteobacteria bacterium]
MKANLDAVDEADKDAVLKVGIDFAVEQCAGLLKQGVPSLHFYTMDRRKSTTEIINRLKGNNLL